MTVGWAGPSWGEPSAASQAPVPLRSPVTATDAAYRAEAGCSDGFLVMAATVAGVGHRLARRRGDDTFGWALARPGKLLVVIADGVSSALHGGHGAELAVQAACNHAASWVARGPEAQPEVPSATSPAPDQDEAPGMELCLGALMDANAVLVAAAQDMGLVGRELATTLVVAVLDQGGADAQVSLARVGDSAAFVLSGGSWEEMGVEPPALGEEPEGPHSQEGSHTEQLASTSTAALPAASVEEVDDVAVGSFTLSSGDCLVLMTDGIANALRDGPSTVAPSLATVLAEGPAGRLSPLSLATAADFSRRGCQDDRALLATWLVPRQPV